MRHFRRAFFLSALLAASVFVTPAQADCQRNGNTVLCTGQDANGFQAFPESLTLRVAPQSLVTTIDSGELSGACPLTPPAIDLGARSSVLNEGTVIGAGVCGWAIFTGDDSSVENAGGIFSTGRVGHGIITGARSTVVNAGGITTNDLGAIGIIAGNDSAVTIAATGRIATAAAGAAGVLSGANSAISNAGTVITAGGVSHGLEASSGSTITNAGTVAVSAAGSIGLRVQGGNADVANFGDVQAVFTGQTDAPGRGAGIDVTGDSISIDNSGSVTASYAGLRLSANVSAIITNSGFITTQGERRGDGSFATGGGALLLYAAPGTAVQINNSGQIRSDVGPALLVTGGNITMTNSGAIAGDAVFGGGDDFLTILPGGSISGVLDGGGGSDFLALSGDAPFTTFNGTAVNVETLLKTGNGAWTLPGAISFSAQANIISGVLRLAAGGRLAVPQTGILSAGTLSGMGTIDGALLNNGTLLPGATGILGQLSISGAFTQTATGKLAISIMPNGASSSLVVGAAANLNGILHVNFLTTPGNARYQGGESYDLIIPGGSAFTLNGSFASVESNATFLTPRVVAGADGGLRLRIDRLSYGSVAETNTQRAVGELFDRLQSAAVPPALLASDLSTLDFAEADDARALFDALAPESVPALQNLALFSLSQFQKAAVDARRAFPMHAFRTWGQFFDRSGSSGGRANFAHYRYGVQSGAGGLDYALDEDTSIGIAAGYADGDARFVDRPVMASISASLIGVSATHHRSRLIITGGVAYGNADSTTSRSQTLQGSVRMLSAKGSADLFSTTLMAAIDLGGETFTITPHARLAFAWAKLKALDEAEPLSVRSDSSLAQSLRGAVGIRAGAAVNRLRPYVGLSSSVEMLRNHRNVNASLNGVQNAELIISGATPRRLLLGAEAGLAFEITPNVMLRVDGAIMANDIFSGRQLGASLLLQW